MGSHPELFGGGLDCVCCWVDITHLGVGLVFLDAEAGLRRCSGEAGGGGVAPDLAWVLYIQVSIRPGGGAGEMIGLTPIVGIGA